MPRGRRTRSGTIGFGSLPHSRNVDFSDVTDSTVHSRRPRNPSWLPVHSLPHSQQTPSSQGTGVMDISTSPILQVMASWSSLSSLATSSTVMSFGRTTRKSA